MGFYMELKRLRLELIRPIGGFLHKVVALLSNCVL